MDHVVPDDLLRSAVALLVALVEVAGVVVIFCGAMIGFVRFVRAALSRGGAGSFVPIRLDLGRYLALGLEFQLGSDLLRTAVAPTFHEIGQLAAVAAIRTGLNFFLAQEIRRERAELANVERVKLDASGPT